MARLGVSSLFLVIIAGVHCASIPKETPKQQLPTININNSSIIINYFGSSASETEGNLQKRQINEYRRNLRTLLKTYKVVLEKLAKLKNGTRDVQQMETLSNITKVEMQKISATLKEPNVPKNWVLRVAIPDDSKGFLLARRVGSRVPEQRVSVLGYADDLAIVSSTVAGAQEMFSSLTATARRVGLQVNAAKTEVLCVPGPQVNVFFDEVPLPICQRSFTYLGGRVPSCSEDLLRRKRLAWTAMGRLRAVFASEALTDELRVRLFTATIETVLLYNAVTWTLTRTLETELDGAHSHLLRAAFNVHWPERVRNADLYQRAGLLPPSQRLRQDRRALAGELLRTEKSCPQPAQRLLLWRPAQRQRRGQGQRKTYREMLHEDCGAPDLLSADQHVRRLAQDQKI